MSTLFYWSWSYLLPPFIIFTFSTYLLESHPNKHFSSSFSNPPVQKLFLSSRMSLPYIGHGYIMTTHRFGHFWSTPIRGLFPFFGIRKFSRCKKSAAPSLRAPFWERWYKMQGNVTKTHFALTPSNRCHKGCAFPSPLYFSNWKPKFALWINVSWFPYPTDNC